MADFRLQAPDFSPLWNLVQMKRQDEQMAYERDRANKLDQLAMAEFQERIKQNAIDNKIRQKNADTNQRIADSNLENSALSRQATELEMRQLEQQIEAQQQQLDQSRIKIAFSNLGPSLEAAIGSLESGQDIPEELTQSLLQGAQTAAETFSEGPYAENFSNLKTGIEKALQSGDINDWESVIGGAERILQFAAPDVSPEDQLDLQYRQAQIADINSRVAEREQGRVDEREEQQQAQEAAQGSLERMLDTVNFLLEEDRYQAVSGLRRAANPRLGVMPILSDKNQTINARFNNLLSMLSLEEREKLAGSGQISDFEARQLGQGASALGNEKGIGEDGAKQELERLQKLLQGKLGVSSNSGIIDLEDF